MSVDSSGSKRHHNPVDSLCRKIQSINMLDRTSNPALQIPKLRSKNFDSPQGNVKKNLEEILKRRTLKTSGSSGASNEASFLSHCSDEVFSPCPQTLVPNHRRISDIRSENKTFSTSRNKDRASRLGLPTVQMGSYSSPPFRSRETAWGHLLGNPSAELKGRPPHECDYFTSSPSSFAYDLKSVQPTFQSPVAKRLSLGWRLSLGPKEDENADISLICEEDLLTTIFCACDVDRRGKVAVSTIVDFLRHTTSQGSEDGSLEDLCNMLDPDHRDVSMDLETYHAIMKEWIDDCKRNWEEEAAKKETADLEEPVMKLQERGLAAKRTPVRMNVTSGSLEALGGDVSKGDLETSDLITCVADLQFNNQKLQEENSQMKLAMDALEEANNRLMEDSEELRNQIKSFQQSVTQVRNLTEELEEAKGNLSASEENALKLFTQNKQLEKENQSLILKISSLQEENIKNVLDSDGLEKNIAELSRNVAELQLQLHMYENSLMNKDTSLLKKDLDIQELKSALKEYATVVETLRAEKSKLVSNIQQMQQELISNGINFPLIYKFNSSVFEGAKSLHCELELAQGSSEITEIEWTALDKSLEREVLLLLQGPEQVGEKFKATIRTLVWKRLALGIGISEELSQVEELVKLHLLWTDDLETSRQEAYEKKLAALRQDLTSKKALWLQKLDLLEAQKESLDKELIKMAGNLRRMRTEQLHLKKELSLRQHELESAKQMQEDAVGEGDLLRAELQELTKQLEDTSKKVRDQERDLRGTCEQARALQRRLEESVAEQGELQVANTSLARTCQGLEKTAKGQSVVLDLLREKLFQGLLGRVLCQSCVCANESPLSGFNLNEEGSTEKNTCCCKGLETRETSLFSSLSRSATLNGCLLLSPLLDALALESLQLIERHSVSRDARLCRSPPTSKEQRRRNGSLLDVTLEAHKCRNSIVGRQTDADLCVSCTKMDADLAQESDAAPLTDVISSREHIPLREVSVPSSESTNSLHVTDPARLHTMKERTCETTSVAQEETVAAEQETKEVNLNIAGTAGDSSSPVAANSAAVERIRQKGNVSPNEREVEAEFLRLSLGFKCDLFTLEKRVRLEERSRDLAEGNLKKEIAGALKLLESLASLSEDNQSQEIVKKLQKSLELLGQYATRVASKAEMLGAIHQESRVSKAVEVMIQHVENLKRTYTREHAELEELKEVLFQNEKSFSSSGDRDESSSKKLSSSLKVQIQSSLRRVSVATLPRNAGNAGSGLPSAQLNDTDGSERNDKYNRRPSWCLVGAKPDEKRPSLQRYISSHSWTESEEEQVETQNTPLESPEAKGSKTWKLSGKESASSKWLHSARTRVSSWAASLRTTFCRANKTFCVSLIAVVLLAVLSSFLVGLSFQRPAEAAPVGTGSAWTSIQQLLWPHTGLLHEGPPPV
ncbi:inositol 1,4,5-triphosphate receptor associated 2 [Eublepharis macularius]|uniref:Inositol 1,4,5-triphosphate receptor associated 2 n=1 Tax=Eublepharis macularius TaxID=481883 RepID=A0AA97JWU4_EUBMA|nr:inositol 1,4,5-triphosphate receptor associated 2 [Eublepharis macularius]